MQAFRKTMVAFKCCAVVLLVSLVSVSSEKIQENEIRDGFRALKSGDDLVSAVAEDCTVADGSVTTCIRQKVLSYMNKIFGVEDQFQGRGWSDEHMDEIIAGRIVKYANTHEFKVQLPEFLFQKAILTFSPARAIADFKVQFPETPKNEERSMSEARGLLKKKLLLPLLLLVKLKLKAITPILLFAIGIKAFKAFVMSKISLLLVIGFLILQLCKKAGMMMPMPAATATEPPIIYGPAPTPAPYGAPAPTPDNSYGPWDSSNGNGGPYARWDAHNIAYSSYQPETTGKTAQQNKQQPL